MDVRKLRVDLATTISEADRLAAQHRDGVIPPDVQDQIAGLLGQSDVIKAQLQLAGRLEDARTFAAQPTANPISWRMAAPGEGEFAIDGKSWRKLTVETPFGTKSVRYNVPLAAEQRGYGNAFEAYLNKRYFDQIGPTDRKTLTEGTDGAGGFIIPPDFQAEIIRKTLTLTQIRANAMVIQTSRDVAQWPKVSYSADDKYTSGVRLTWPGESPASATVHRVTDPVFGLYSIPVHVAMASMPMSNSLLEDSSFDVVGVSTDLFAEAFALGEEDAFLLGGTGSTVISRPMGILAEVDGNGPASVASKNSNQTLDADDIINMFYAVPVQYRARGKWIINSNTMKALEKLKDSQGRYLISSLLQANLATPQFDTLKGKPVLVDEFTPDYTVSGNYPIIFGDLTGYMIVDRVGLSVQKLTELYAETDVTLLLARKRVGGYPVRPWQMKVARMQ